MRRENTTLNKDIFTLDTPWKKEARTCSPWSHGLRPKKSFKLVWRCHQFLSGFLAKDHLLSVASVTSVANDKNDNEMVLGAVYSLLYSRKPQLGAVRPVIASNGVPFPQMRSVGSHSSSGRKKEGIKERTGK